MADPIRVTFIVASILLLVFSIGLVSYSTLTTTYYPSSGQLTICQQSYSEVLDAGAVLQQKCQASQGEWVEASAVSLSKFNFTLSIWLNETGTSNTLLIYNSTTAKAQVDIPILQNGTLNSQIKNPQKVSNTLDGGFSVYESKAEQVPVAVSAHPYTLIGEGLLGISIVGLFLLIWNPNNILRFRKEQKESGSQKVVGPDLANARSYARADSAFSH